MRGSARAAAKVALLGSSITDFGPAGLSSSRQPRTRLGRMGSRHAGALPRRPAGLSTGHHGQPDSHPRHRSGAPPHRLGPDRGRRQPADLRRLRLGRDQRQGLARRAAGRRSTTGSPRWSRNSRPDEAAVEATFVNKDATATLKLGQARGIALLVPARAGISVAEYAPNLVKKTIVGAGHCEKEQIRMMLACCCPRPIRRRMTPPTRSPSR